MDIKAIQDELIKCNRCGYCLRVCPTYQIALTEGTSARGRNSLLEDLIDGDLPDDEGLDIPFFDCLLCGACTVECFTSVKTDELMVQAREQYYQNHGEPAILRYIFRKLLPSPQRMTYVMRLLSIGKRSGLSTLARRLGVLKWIDASLDGAEGLVARMPRSFLWDRLTKIGFKQQQRAGQKVWLLPPSEEAPAPGPRIVYFVGCGTNFLLPDTGEAAIKLLSLAGCEVIVVEHNCCGLPPYSYGDLVAARDLARQNLTIFGNLEADFLVTECASCSSFLKKYPELLGTDPEWAPAAQEFAATVRDFTEIFPELALPYPGHLSDRTVTYHDPCHLVRGQQITEQPRRLLTDFAGLQLREMVEADWCCGAAGSYNIAHPEMSLQILERKIRRAQATDAEVLATACPACIIQLAYGMRQANDSRPVRHIAELIAEGQGIQVGEP